MNVSSTTSTLQALLSQLDTAAAAPAPKPGPVQTAEAPPRQVAPTGKATLDPNAPRGTYLNIVV